MWFLFGLLTSVVFVAISIFFTLRSNGFGWLYVVQTSDVIKLFMVYIQRLAIVTRIHVSSFRRVAFYYVQTASQSFVNPLVISMDCLFLSRPALSFGITRLMLTTVVPLGVFLAALPIALVLHRWWVQWRKNIY